MIKLYTAATPNGRKISIMLEETGLEYSVHSVDLDSMEQKQDWFLKINPNGRIPAMIDKDNGNLCLFESGAMLIYLADKAGRLLPRAGKARYRVMQWLMFQMAGLGPMQGQAHVFYRYAPRKIKYAIDRYQNETKRLYGVLDKQLSQNEFIAGGRYSIADIAHWPWINEHEWAGVDIRKFPDLRRWHKQIGKKTAVIKGMKVPQRSEEQDVKKARVKKVRNILA